MSEENPTFYVRMVSKNIIYELLKDYIAEKKLKVNP